MTIAAWMALTAYAQDDGPIGQIEQGLTGGSLVSVETQRQLGLVNVSGDCSGTLINRYWVLTAHHCVSVGNLLGATPDMPSNIPVTAAWAPATVRRPTQIVTYAFTDGLDVALLYLGEGDFGPASSQPLYVEELETSMSLRKYGQGRSTFANGDVVPPTPSVSDHEYRTALFNPSSVSSTSYRISYNNAGQTGHGGDSGGPDIVISGGVPIGIAGIQSTCKAKGYVPGMPENWDWVTGILYCDSASLFTLRDRILATAQEFPQDRDWDDDPLPNFSLVTPSPNGQPIWLYSIAQTGNLRWNHQDGVSAGWDSPVSVGSGWNGFLDVVPAGGNRLFAVSADGNLYGYRHDGFANGSSSWTGGTLLRSDWMYPATIGGGDGVLYAIDYDGTLLWYRCNDLERANDPAVWSGPSAVGWGWDQFETVVSTGDGTLYAMLPDGDLWVYHHDGFSTGTYAWSNIRKVGNGWDMFDHIVGLDNNVLIGIEPDGTVSWYHHLGRSGSSGYQMEHEVWEGPVQLGGGFAGLPDVFTLLGVSY